MAEGSVTVEINGDAKGFDEELNAVSKSASRFGGLLGGVGSVAKTAAAVGVAAVGAARVAVVALTKTAVQSYAEYEQLVGGVETLFGTAADTVQAYAANAYKTAGMSANDYMSTVTSFSASLIQSLGGDTAAAAEIANMALTDMSDNVNKMGSSMESVQDAYQGFAKQNYTMLDNLKLGYGGTQAEMQRLLSDAEALSGVHYDIGNLDDVFSAIHVIQTEIGVTGTTAKEALGTISGSVTMTKAAWQNLLTGIADDNADMGALIDNFVTSATAAADNLLPRIQIAIQGIGQLVTGLAPVIGAQLPALLDSLIPSLITSATSLVQAVGGALPGIILSVVSNLPALIEGGAAIIASLAQGLAQAIPQLVEMLPQIIEAIVSGLIAAAPALLSAGGALIGALVEGAIALVVDLLVLGRDLVSHIASGISGATADARAAIGTVMATIFTGIADFIVTAIDKGVELVSNIASGIASGVGAAVSAISSVVSGILERIQSAASEALAKGRELVSNIASGISGAVGTAVSAIAAVVTGILNKLTEAASKALTKGREIVSKIASGIRAGISAVTGAISSIGSAIQSKLASIASQAVGWAKHIVSNIAAGIRAGIGAVTSAASSVASAISGLLHHTTPDYGPMKDDDTWMPDMMRQFASGIAGNMKLIWDEITTLSNGMKVEFEGVGFNVAAGFGLGMEKATSYAVEAAEGLVRESASKIKALNEEIAQIEAAQQKRQEEDEVKQYERNLRDKKKKLADLDKDLAEDLAELEEDRAEAAQKKTQAERQKAYNELAKKEAKLQEDYKENKEKALEDLQDLQDDWAEKQLKKQEDAQKALLESQIEALEDFSDAYQKELDKVVDSYEDSVDAITGRRDKLAESLADTDLFKINEQGKAVFVDMKKDVQAIEAYGEAMNKLRERGIDKNLYAEILELDAEEATKFANRLLSLGDKQWDDYIALYQKKQEVAQSVAQGIYGPELDAAAEAFMDSLPEEMEKAGKSAMEALGEGITVEGQEAVQAMASVADQILAEIARINAGAKLRAAVEASASSLSAGLTGASNQSSEAKRAVQSAAAAEMASAYGLAVTGGGAAAGGTIVLEVNGKEFARATVDDFRKVEDQSPRIVSDK